tara:strand:- start:31605 stop:31817 length:213 start_codon:yes stop_codon:yes gene_type:complete
MAITMSNQNAIHTLLHHKARRGELTKQEIEELDVAMTTPLARGNVDEGELIDVVRERHDDLFAKLKELVG